MNQFVVAMTRGHRRLITTLALAGVLMAGLPAAASAYTQADVNAAIANGVGYLDANQNSNGSWGSSFPGAESALALASYGVLDSGKFANLSPTQQAHVQNGLTYLLGTQNIDGSFDADGFKTYDTGLALTALSLSTDVPTTTPGAVATAIANARSYLIGAQNIPPHGGISCQSTGLSGSGLGGQSYCGGWDYVGPDTRSDESNTGFALTGLDVTGGVPPSVAAANIGWQRNVQQLTSNPGGFPARNDGGGAYEPGINSSSFSSNANDTGSLLFGFGYDGVPASDPAVSAAITFGNDVLNAYEKNKATRTMLYHTAMNEDGSCVITAPGCTWTSGAGEGGYHYSLFALVKGLSQYAAPNLGDPNNFYAKAVDLLLSQQASDGSWPADPRDDASIFGATGFAILALGKVGTPEQPITATGTPVSATEGQSFNGAVATFNDPDTNAIASEYSASVNWGDGTTSSGTISGSGGKFTVSGSHTYAEEGSRSIKVTITDVDLSTNPGTATSTATIKDAALSATAATVSAIEGTSTTQAVATFSDADPAGAASDYTATIAWGDGTTSSGTVAANGSGFQVVGTHSYVEEGSDTVKVTITDAGGASAGTSGTAAVADAKLSAKGVGKIKHATVSGTVASFTDANPHGSLSDFSASINWGDGAKTTGTITAGTGAFNVRGSHHYTKTGSFHINVTIKDIGGQTAVASSRVSLSSPGQAAVLGVQSGRPATCLLSAFTLKVRGKRISHVTIQLDGRRVSSRAVHRGSLYRARIAVSPGMHRLTVKVSFSASSHTRARILHRSFKGCPIIAPKFTG